MYYNEHPRHQRYNAKFAEIQLYYCTHSIYEYTKTQAGTAKKRTQYNIYSYNNTTRKHFRSVCKYTILYVVHRKCHVLSFAFQMRTYTSIRKKVKCVSTIDGFSNLSHKS